MTPFLRCLTIFAAAMLAACGQPEAPDAAAPSGPSPAEGSVAIERTPCFGFCPVYKATVTADDRLTFEGERFVAAMGAQEKMLPEGSFAKLVAIARARDFAAFDASYPNEAGDNCPQQATDLPGIVIDVRSLELTHSVRFDQGCFGFDGRENLEAMIAEIDAALALEEWIGPREDFMGSRE